MQDATPQRDRGDGKPLMGPSGAPIWNSPAVDEKRGLIYFGTGESNSPPAHKNTNALIAIGLKDGKEKWSFQATPADIYNSGCGLNPRADQLNCTKPPETVYRDVDFGGSSVLGRQSNGKELVYSGQKSGSVWALEPETGKVVWRTSSWDWWPIRRRPLGCGLRQRHGLRTDRPGRPSHSRRVGIRSKDQTGPLRARRSEREDQVAIQSGASSRRTTHLPGFAQWLARQRVFGSPSRYRRCSRQRSDGRNGFCQ